jgi:hypothetical protein
MVLDQKTGDILTPPVVSGSVCVFPRVNVHTNAVAGRQRFVTLGQDDLCRVVVLDHGEKNGTNQDPRFVKSSASVLKRTVSDRATSASTRGLMADYSHEHYFGGIAFVTVMEIHTSMFFDYDYSYAWIDNRQQGVNWFPTQWFHSQVDSYPGSPDCVDGPVGGYVNCWNSGGAASGFDGVYVQVEAFGYFWGAAGCSSASGSYSAGGGYLHSYACG